MLWAVLADFRKLGSVHTLTTLDCRIDLQHRELPADEVFTVEPDQREQVFTAMLERCDAALIIAPETDGNLARLSQIVEDRGIPLLGSFAAAVKIAGDKGICYRLFSSWFRLIGRSGFLFNNQRFACLNRTWFWRLINFNFCPLRRWYFY